MALQFSKNGQVIDNSIQDLWSKVDPKLKGQFEQNLKDTSQLVQTTQTPFSPEDLDKYANMMRGLPEYQGMVDEDARVMNMRDAVANLPVPERSGWVAPLAALTDTWTKSKLAGSVPKIEGNSELLLGLQNKANENKKRQLDAILSSTDKFKSGTTGLTTGSSIALQPAGPQKGAGKGKLGYVDKKAIDTYAPEKTMFQDAVDAADEMERIAGELEAMGSKAYLTSPLEYNKRVKRLESLNVLANAAKLKPMSDTDLKTLGSDAWRTFASDKDNISGVREKARILKRAGGKGLNIQKRIFEGSPEGYGAARIAAEELMAQDKNTSNANSGDQKLKAILEKARKK